MPFIVPSQRDKIKTKGLSACEAVGDLCFVFYQHMMQVWTREPRWTTAHRLYREFVAEPEASEYLDYLYREVRNQFELADVVVAANLAYIEFYRNHVSKYEDEKRTSNGDIHG